MARPIGSSLMADLQISEALLDQLVWAGVADTAKSEILFQTGHAREKRASYNITRLRRNQKRSRLVLVLEPGMASTSPS